MDASRQTDLARLYGIFNNPLQPWHNRKAARRSFNNIQAQMKDRKLTKLRYRLIQAMRFGTEAESGKIEQLLVEYSKNKRWNRHG